MGERVHAKQRQLFARTGKARIAANLGAVAQLGERVLCKHEVIGSIPFSSTIFFV